MRHLSAFFTTDRLKSWALILLGSAVAASAYPMFLTPCQIVPGGRTGVAMILNHLFHWPIGMTSLALCVPLFLAGWKQSGLIFVLRSLGATALFSVLIDLLPLPPMSDDILIATVYGAALLGIGLALILIGGATTGGTDMLAEMLHRRFPAIRVGVFLAVADGSVILAAAFIMGTRAALYALINILLCAFVIDKALAGAGNAKACYIISDKAEQITRRIMDEMERGATLLNTTGAYSGRERKMILCVCPTRQITRLKKITRQEDPKAFVIISNTHETLGEGFQNLAGL